MHDRLAGWWSTISLRSKITGVTVFLLVTGLTVAGAGTMFVVSNYLTEATDARLTTYISTELPETITLDGENTFSEDVDSGGNPFYLAAIDSEGTLIEDNLPESRRDYAPDVHDLSLLYVSSQEGAFTLANERNTAQWRVAALPLKVVGTDGSATLLVGISLGDNNALLNRYAAIFVFFALIVVIFGAALSRLLVTSTFAPLREVEATAARFAAGDFSQRLSGAPPNTEVGRLNRSLNAMLNRIDRAFADRARTIEQMRRFVGDASHELRTPLVSVRGYAELYRMGALPGNEEVAQAMDRIEKEAIRMSELVNDLLELARIDEAKPLQLAAVDLVPIARDTAMDAMAAHPERTVTAVITDTLVSPHISEISAETATITIPAAGPPATPSKPMPALTTGPIAFAGATLARLRELRARQRKATPVQIELGTEAPPASAAIVPAEENKIRQVVANLMGNALRYTAPGTPIEVAVEVDAEHRRGIISVVDHGEGIPPQLREKIFQRFFRADTSRTRDTGGSGLGLAIAASIITAHKGEVQVLETPGGGATFRVSLPLLQPGQDPSQSTPHDH